MADDLGSDHICIRLGLICMYLICSILIVSNNVFGCNVFVHSDVYMRSVSNVPVFGRIISLYLSCMRLDSDDGWLVSGIRSQRHITH